MLATVVNERTYFAPCSTSNNWVTYFERAFVDEHRGNRATTNVEFGFKNNALGAARWVHGEFFEFCNSIELFEKIVDTKILLC